MIPGASGENRQRPRFRIPVVLECARVIGVHRVCEVDETAALRRTEDTLKHDVSVDVEEITLRGRQFVSRFRVGFQRDSPPSRS